jgi:DNA-binding transcriptional LysR family regulator
MNDRLIALRLFARVARTGSFSGAGREVGLSQPSASRLISALEADVGVALFTRTTRAVTLTEAGARYLERIEPILAALDEADHDARGTGELRGTLRIGLSSGFGTREVIPRLPRFMNRHPALRIELLMDDQLQNLVTEGVDVALRFGVLADSSATAKRIMAWPRVLAASPAYLAQAGTPQTPSDLATHIAIIGPMSGASDWSFRKNGHVTSVHMNSKLMITIHEGSIAAAVAGLGIIPTSLVGCRRELADGTLVRVLPEWDMGPIESHAVVAGGRAAKPAARVFTEFLVEEFQKV